MISKVQKAQIWKLDVCSKNSELQFFVCWLTFCQSAFLVARIESHLLVMSKYVSLLFETNHLFLRILMWTSYREMRKTFYLFFILNLLFWFYKIFDIMELICFWRVYSSLILRRNCLLQRVIEGKIKGGIEVTGSRGRKRKKLLDDLKERRGYSHLKEEALDRAMWRARFGRGFGPVVRQTTKWWFLARHVSGTYAHHQEH